MTDELWNIVYTFSTIGRERFRAALPDSLSGLKTVIEEGSAPYSTPNRVRSLEWLEENGMCLDNIRPGPSTVSGAGKGAFATRFIGKSSIIAPVPVVQILRRHLEIYERMDEEDEDSEVEFVGHQLLLNYCYGHPKSSLLFFPYSPVVNYINHNSERANAELRWSTRDFHKKEWMGLTPEYLARKSHAGLVMEIVATRDVGPGEEIFLDYGREWEEDWNSFSTNFDPDEEMKSHVYAHTLNERHEWLRTVDELEKDPYPENVMTVCFIGKMPRPRVNEKEGGPPQFRWGFYSGIHEDFEGAFACHVLERDEIADLDDAVNRKDSINPADLRYVVSVTRDADDEEDSLEIYTGVPRTAIRFFDAPYTTDMFLRSAFRHEIGLPDSMVPEAWRDVL